VLAFSGIVCVAPLRLGGLRGKKSTPSIGWEVLVRSHWSTSGIWMERMHWEDIFTSSSSVKVRLLKLLLVIKFNLHLFILLYSDDDFISMSFPCTCISTVIVISLSLDSSCKKPCYPQYLLFLSYCLIAWPE
jgi:hypothetical protein